MNIKDYQSLNEKVDSLWKAYGTDVRLKRKAFNDEDRALDEMFKEVVSKGGDENVLTGEEREILLKPSESYGTKIGVAQRVLAKLGTKIGGATAAVAARPQGHTKGAAAAAYVDILKNKDKYGIEGKTEEEILEAAWYSTETTNQLHPDQIKEDVIKKKQAERRAELEKKIKDKEALENKYAIDATRIAAQGPTEKELRDARREATIAYLEARQEDKIWAGTTSNSLGELYTAESLAIGAAAIAKAGPLTGEAREAFSGKINDLASKSGAVSGLLKAGKYAEVFRDPGGYLASKAGGAITKFAAKKASEWAVKAALAVGLNAVAPVVGQVAAELVSRVLGPLLQKAIRGSIGAVKNGIKRAGMVLGGLGLLIGSAASSALAAGAGTVAATTIILVPLVAIILFIINASGYVVPPSALLTTSGTKIPTGVTENAYIRVVKTANPPGPFGNGDLPLSVQYTIVITAKKETLSNVTFKYDCQVISDAGGTCPPVDPAVPASPEGGTITTDKPVTITYRQNYSVTFQNSLIMDNLTVTAKVASSPDSQEASGFASIVIGTPPTKCFVMQGNWPPRERGIMLTAIGQIVHATKYTDKMCNGGAVNLIYSSFQETYQGKAYGADTASPNITFYPLALGNVQSAFYTLAHESGHIFSHRSNLQDLFIQEGIPTLPEGRVCTYPFTYDPPRSYYEDFAESIATYLVGQSLSSATRDFSCMNGGNLYSVYPKHWCFMRKNVFEEKLSWNVNESVCN